MSTPEANNPEAPPRCAVATGTALCNCGNKPGPTGLCNDCFLGHDTSLGSLTRPKHRDKWTRGFVCAVAKYVEMYGDGTEATELMRLAGKKDYILKHADEEDILTLREAGLLPSTSTQRGDCPRAK